MKRYWESRTGASRILLNRALVMTPTQCIGYIAMHADEERERVLARAKAVVRDEPNLGNMVNQIDACLRAAFRLREDRICKR